MKGDFSRDSFDPRKRYSRVLMQMGRVLTDADWNEQADTVLHLLRAMASDIFGPHGGPTTNLGFEIFVKPHPSRPEVVDLYVREGHYYVDGILCENDQKVDGSKDIGVKYYEQPYFPLPTQAMKDRFKIPDPAVVPFIVYLDVWERLITGIEDPSIREVALGGPDTTTRTQVVWQARLLPLGPTGLAEVTCQNVQNTQAWQDNLVAPLRQRGRLRVKAQEPRPADIGDPCNISPDARYRGAENQLYRVEIHHEGKGDAATFKWSRDNGSVVFPVLGVAERTITLAHIGRDTRLGLRTGDWVELVDDDYVLRGEAHPLLQVEEVIADQMKVVLKTAPAATVGRDSSRHPLLRRWDHKEGDPRMGGLKLRDGAAVIVEQAGDAAGWLALEDGIQIKFEPGATYRTGDYWIIEARTATGDVVWPREDGQPAALPPHGVEHYYAPLANIYGPNLAVFDLRHKLTPAVCRDDPQGDGFECPAAIITSNPNPDGTLQFNADVIGGNPSFNPTFLWQVGGGTIMAGQNTNSIQVKPTGTGAVLVKVIGTNFPGTCRNMATFIWNPAE
ncbi:MAG TPA: DUF6519 domain-containing protein [Pyrinomonadaceae bacterium]|nr:DUF6519 domain-containing protein [Pyrinomonadaceae bacterium]